MAPRCHTSLRTYNRTKSIPYFTIRDFYVDELITGSNSIKEAINLNLKNDISALLHKGCFELCKWASNVPQILVNSQVNEAENVVIKFIADQ